MDGRLILNARTRYLELRETQRALNREIVRTLSKKTLVESARDLGLWSDGAIVHDRDEHADVHADYASYDFRTRISVTAR